MWDYNDKVREHFLNPRNVGELEDPDGVGTVGNPVCGDMMEISIRVEHDRIVDIRFRTFGCASAIATTSMLTEVVKGMTLEEAEKVTWDDVIKNLDGLPAVKVHCSLLAVDGLKDALYKYYRSVGVDREDLRPKTHAEEEHHDIVKDEEVCQDDPLV